MSMLVAAADAKYESHADFDKVDCNPALHCNDLSFECVAANQGLCLEPGCGKDYVALQPKGHCTEWQRSYCAERSKSGGPCCEFDHDNFFNISFDDGNKRCLQIVYPEYAVMLRRCSDRKNHAQYRKASHLKEWRKMNNKGKNEVYCTCGNRGDCEKEMAIAQKNSISSCPDGYYTCMNGYCTKDPNECLNECKNHMKAICHPTTGDSKDEVICNCGQRQVDCAPEDVCEDPAYAIRWSNKRCSEDNGDRRKNQQNECPADDITYSDSEKSFEVTRNGESSILVAPLNPKCQPYNDCGFSCDETNMLVGNGDICRPPNPDTDDLRETRTEQYDYSLTIDFQEAMAKIDQSCCANTKNEYNDEDDEDLMFSALLNPGLSITAASSRQFNFDSFLYDEITNAKTLDDTSTTQCNPQNTREQETSLTSIIIRPTFAPEPADSSCCCALRCDCYGDPHCHTFDSKAASSYKNTESVEDNKPLLLYKEGDFSFHISQTGYRGIITEIMYVFNRGRFKNKAFVQSVEQSQACWTVLDYKESTNTLSGRENKKTISCFDNSDDLPSILCVDVEYDDDVCPSCGGDTYELTNGRGLLSGRGRGLAGTKKKANKNGRKKRKAGKTSSKKSGGGGRRRILSKLESDFKQAESRLECPKDTFENVGYGSNLFPRFDVEVVKPLVKREFNEGCPNPVSKLKDLIADDNENRYDGFCFGWDMWNKNPSIAEYFAEEGTTYDYNVNVNGRLLRKKNDKDEDVDITEFCALEASQSNNPDAMIQCLSNVADFGLEAVMSESGVLNENDQDCVSISDIDLENLCDEYNPDVPTCKSGLILQTRERAKGQWKSVLFLPSYKKYCNNEIIINLEKSGFELEKYELRITEPVSYDHPFCDSCTPNQLLEDLVVEAKFSRKVTDSAIIPYCPLEKKSGLCQFKIKK